MGETEIQKRLREIAVDVIQWGLGFMALVGRITQVRQMPDISDADKLSLAEAAERLGKLFDKVVELNATQPTAREFIEQLISSHDRLREETAKLNHNIDRLLASRKA